MDVEEFVNRGWAEHGDHAADVWDRLPQALAHVDTPRRIFVLGHLATHVAGEHLGRWDDGVAFLDRLAALPAFDAAAAEGKGVRRLQAALHYCAGRKAASEASLAAAQPGGGVRPESARVRMLAVAASALAHQGRAAEAIAAFDEALALASYGPGRDDPAARDLAITGNNLSVEMETKPALSDDERALMLRAARAGRHWWEVAGGWLETERAEYRLAQAHLKAGLPTEALAHAEACLRIVDANGADATETFFAHEVLALSRVALGDASRASGHRDRAAAALPGIGDAEFRGYCAGELAKLDTRLADAR